MISIPLPVVVVLFLGMFLLRILLNERAWSVSSKAFAALLGLLILQSSVNALVWSFGLAELRPLLPIIGSAMPVLVWFAFKTLSLGNAGLSVREMALRALPTVAVCICIFVLPELVDVIIVTHFLWYGVALLLMAAAGPDGFQQTVLNRSLTAMRAAQMAGLLLIANAVLDVVIIVDFIVTGGDNFFRILGGLSIVILLLIGIASAAGVDTREDDETSDEPRVEAPKLVSIDTPAESDNPDDDKEIAARIETFLKDSRLYTDPDLTLIRLARKSGIVSRKISTAINRHHGMNVSQYINSLRLDEACRLMKTTDGSITNIHLDSGFQTKSNFNREFKRQFQCSPTDWRRTHSEGA